MHSYEAMTYSVGNDMRTWSVKLPRLSAFFERANEVTVVDLFIESTHTSERCGYTDFKGS